jgi:hypothetical protein
MKNNSVLNIIAFLAIVLFIAGCEKELDISPRSSLSPGDVTASDAEALLTGCYDGVQGGGGRHFYLSYLTDDNSSDNIIWRRFWKQHQEIDNNNIQTSNSMIDRWWGGYYVNINRVNSLLESIINVDESNFTPAERKKEILAEARFLRAWNYFYLVTRWGDVPLILDGKKEEFPERTEESKIWDQIESDLEFAKDNAPAFSSSYTVSAEASKAFLARVMLYRGNKSGAKTIADNLITNKNFAMESFAKVFDGTGTSKEFILQWNNNTNDGAYFGFWLVNRLELTLDQSLVDAFEDGDERKNVTCKTFKGIKVCGKYPNSGFGTDNWPVVRIAELYLIAAEATGYPAGVDYLNTLRSNRGLGNLTVTDEQDFENKLLHERRVELAVEGFRWYDLIRFGKAVDILPNVKTTDQLKYPIPQGERDVNKNLTQNKGY